MVKYGINPIEAPGEGKLGGGGGCHSVTAKIPGPGCSKLTTLLVNVSFEFQVLIKK